MVLRELLPEEEVLYACEESVGDVLVARHTPFKAVAAEDAGGDDHIVYPRGHHEGHGGEELRGVLVVGVKHDDDVRLEREGCIVAGFLVCAVAEILLVEVEVLDVALFGNGHGAVRAVVINQDDVIHDVGRDFFEGLTKGFFCIVGGENHRDAFAVNHLVRGFCCARRFALAKSCWAWAGLSLCMHRARL